MVYHTYEKIVGKQSILRGGAIAVDAEVINAPNDSIGNTNEMCVLWIVGNRAIRTLDIGRQVLISSGSSFWRAYRKRLFENGNGRSCQTFTAASRAHFVMRF